MTAIAGFLLLSYLIGSLPTAVITGRLVKGIDIRKEGSGNAGATNIGRVLGWKAGVTVLLIDFGKGVLAAAAIPLLPFGPIPFDPAIVAILCGLAAVIGHVFPVYTGFCGGKGVATTAGMLLAVAPLPAGIAATVFGATVLLFGRISLGSLTGALTVPLAIILLNRCDTRHYHPLLIVLSLALALFILFTHRANIVRLLRGTEQPVLSLQVWKRFFRH